MNIQKIYDNQASYNLSVEFTEVLNEVKPLSDSYIAAAESAQHYRMLIVGKLQDYRINTANTADRKAIRIMLKDLSQDQLDNIYKAYKTYNQLLSTNVPEYKALAEASNQTQLIKIGRGYDTSLPYDAAKQLKRTGSVPSVAKIDNYLNGKTNNNFETKSRFETVKSEQPEPKAKTEPTSTTTPYIAPAPPTKEDMEYKRLEGVNRNHCQALIENQTLELIDTPKLADAWMSLGSSPVDLFRLIEQRLLVENKKDCSTELRLRELLDAHVARVQQSTEDQQVTRKQTLQEELANMTPHERFMRLNHPSRR
jgi:hypothetical protein